MTDYQKIKLIWVSAVKFDGRRRARLVAGGHTTEDMKQYIYSGVVDLDMVRLCFVAAVLYDLGVIAGDVASAYIQAFTCEKVYFRAGEEFGKLAGELLIIVKALYGLKSSGGMWHRRFADNLRDMGFVPTKTCLLYTSPSPRDLSTSRMPSSA